MEKRTVITNPQRVQSFSTGDAFRAWLQQNHQSSSGLWLQIFKKNSGRATVTYAEALDHALCFGWIDGQKKSHDADSWIQRFTPRRPRSSWSKINTGHAERLIQAGQMEPAGLAVIQAAKADGRWAIAYDSPRTATPPADFLAAVAKRKKTREFFASLNKANVYAIVYRLQTAKKPETRARRFAQILAMLERGEKFH